MYFALGHSFSLDLQVWIGAVDDVDIFLRLGKTSHQLHR